MNGSTPSYRHLPTSQAGRSLIELMVALVIGFIILGAVMLTSIGGNLSSTRQNAAARMNDDVGIITNVLNWHLRVAGYSTPLTYQAWSSGQAQANRNYTGPAVRGCENGISNLNAADYTLIACNGGAAGAAPDAFAVMYEADASTTIPAAGNVPTDCLGQAIPNTTASDLQDGSMYRRAENRFYLAVNPQTGTRSLYCAGSGNVGVGQPLVDNVLDMQISYGVADVPTAAQSDLPQAPFFEPIMYLRGDQVQALPAFPVGSPMPIDNWQRVVSIRICLLMASEPNAVDNPTPYVDCNGVTQTPTDRRLYRAVTFTTAFKNRTAACSDATASPTGINASANRCAF